MNTKQIMDVALELAGLSEPPGDSAILVPGENIKKAMIGVDIGVAELLLAKDLGCDLVIAHHPGGAGSAVTRADEVMDDHIESLVRAGVTINKAQKAVADEKGKVERRLHPANYDRVASAAALLGMPFMAIHTPADILAERKVQSHLDQALAGKERASVGDVIEALNQLPEYQNTLAKPVIRVGSEKDYAGKVYVTMSGGTGGGIKVEEAYFQAGVGTIVEMHMPEDVLEAVKKQNIGNVVIAGHMASDSVGLNQIVAALEERGLEIIRVSGVTAPR